jgi:hypothetical protein
MAATRKNSNLSPKDCDRWDTIPVITKTISKPTAAQKKLAAEINAQRAKEAAAKKAPKKTTTKKK